MNFGFGGGPGSVGPAAPEAPPHQVGQQTAADGTQTLEQSAGGAVRASAGLIGTASYTTSAADAGASSTLLNDLVVVDENGRPQTIFVQQKPRSSGRGGLGINEQIPDFALISTNVTALRSAFLEASDAAIRNSGPKALSTLTPAQIDALKSKPAVIENFNTTADGRLRMGRITSGFALYLGLFLEGGALQNVVGQTY